MMATEAQALRDYRADEFRQAERICWGIREQEAHLREERSAEQSWLTMIEKEDKPNARRKSRDPYSPA